MKEDIRLSNVVMLTPSPYSLPQKGDGERKVQEITFMISSVHHSLKVPAFTLAEVLITLGIIGVVAAITLPSLIQNYREKQRITQLKKAYSVMQNAFLMAKEDYGEVTDWGLTITNTGEKDNDGNDILDNSGNENVINILMKYVEKSKLPQNSYIGNVESLDGRQAFWPWKSICR